MATNDTPCSAELHLFKRIWQSIGLVLGASGDAILAARISTNYVSHCASPTKPLPDPDLARGVWAEGAALPPAASSDFDNGAGRLCCAPGLV